MRTPVLVGFTGLDAANAPFGFTDVPAAGAGPGAPGVHAIIPENGWRTPKVGIEQRFATFSGPCRAEFREVPGRRTTH
jgi:hypothetical protein